jgi:predicted nuclease of predicted toxin-antitoxin system
MRILLDECVDWRLLRDLAQHDVKSARQVGLSSTDDGDLLRRAQLQFDVLITTDKNLAFQQNVGRFEIAVVVLQGRSSRLHHLRELVPQLLGTLPSLRRGGVHWISWRDNAPNPSSG